MNADELHRLGLDEGIGYKVKVPQRPDRCFFRWMPDIQRWQNAVTGLTYSEQDAIKLLVYEMKFGTLSFYMCACAKCAAKPGWKEAAIAFRAVTGESVSHGINKECQEAEEQRLRAEMDCYRKGQ